MISPPLPWTIKADASPWKKIEEELLWNIRNESFIRDREKNPRFDDSVPTFENFFGGYFSQGSHA